MLDETTKCYCTLYMYYQDIHINLIYTRENSNLTFYNTFRYRGKGFVLDIFFGTLFIRYLEYTYNRNAINFI